MHFCFSSMSYNLIRNFWCVASYLNIKIFRWSHWINHPCEIPWDVSCCLSVSLSLFSLLLLSCISISVFWTPALTDCLLTPPLETKESSCTFGNLNGCQSVWVCENRADLIWMKREMLCSLSGLDWKMITLGFCPDRSKTRGGGLGYDNDFSSACWGLSSKSFCLLYANDATCWLVICVHLCHCVHVCINVSVFI